jgi:hypothetical protein
MLDHVTNSIMERRSDDIGHSCETVPVIIHLFQKAIVPQKISKFLTLGSERGGLGGKN